MKTKNVLQFLWLGLCSLSMSPMIHADVPNGATGPAMEAVDNLAIDITGLVTDKDGEPLIGVNVVVKGTNNGTSTDFDGNYQLQGVDEDAVLVFSYIGYRTAEVDVDGRSIINVQLESDAQLLDELVVVGYGTVRKSDLTGAVDRINLEDRENQANVNLLQSLAGATAGVNIESRGGAGGEPSFSIRGQNSLSASNSPLIVLDGIIYNGSISDININDVETIDVLKDASAAAVYGSRSANGVLIITTKSGKSEKPVFSFNSYYGFQDMTNNPMRVMNAEEFAIRLVDYNHQNLLYQWYATNPEGPEGRPERPDVTNRELVASYLLTQEERDNYLAGNSIDWVDEVLQVAPMQNYNLSISGSSNNKINYFLSGSYTDVEGIQINDKYKRLTLRSNLESKVNDWITLGANIGYTFSDYSGQPASLASARVASPLVNNYIGQSSYDIYLGGELFQPYPLVYTYINDVDKRNQLNLVGRIKVNIPWIEGLSNELNYSNRFYNRESNALHGYNTPSGVSNKGLAIKSPSQNRDWILNNIVTYLRSFGNHQINSTLLFSREGRSGNATTARAEGFDNIALGFNNLGLGQISSVTSSAWEENSLAFMARVNYSYASRYMITGTIRRDGFSGFSEGNKWATFPSLSVAWVFSEENALKDLGNYYGKLRLSYGLNGNQGVGRYSSLSRMATSYYVYDKSTAIGLSPSSLGNTDLTWETTESVNLGIDFGFYNSRLNGSIDVYSSNTRDVLVQRQLPRSAGYASVWANIGALKNKGIDLKLNSINFDTQNFGWESQFVFSLNRNKITRLYGSENDADIGNAWFVGEPISALYDFRMTGGVWTEEEFFAGQIPLQGWYPGQFRYDDINGDGVISPTDDRTIIGYADPSYRFSINNTLTYGAFSLDVNINSIQGGDKYYKANIAQYVNPLFYFPNRHNNSAINDYWRPDAPTTNTTGIYNNPPQESGIYQSRSFVRLQDVTLAYTFDKSVLNAVGMNSLQIYVSSKNPYVWTKWQGWDPESGLSDTPVMRNVIAGIRLSF